MSEALTFNNLTDLHFSPYAISTPQNEEFDKILEQEKIIADKSLLLKKDIGEKLFNQLSYDDRVFMIETAGSIDFGRTVDLSKISKEIDEYKNF